MATYHRVGSATVSAASLDQSPSPYVSQNPRWHEQSPLSHGASEWHDEYPPEPQGFIQPAAKSKRRWPLWILLAALVIIAAAVVIPVYFLVIKHKDNHTTSGSTSSTSTNTTTSGGTGPKTQTVLTGGDGSKITTEDGDSFIYNNTFGGFWYSDPNDPFNDSAQPNSWTPPLNQTWKWGRDRVYGVNLGGLFVIEPFITPVFFQKYPTASDEWSLSQLMAADTASGGIGQLEDHYKTFITEKDIAQIAGAGLNWIRLPIPFWAIETWPGEPFLPKTCWKYILRVLQWCRKYGIRVSLDLHTLPGSQNGLNHSGKLGKPNFLNGVMGIANAQRSLEYIRVITEFISQPEYKNLVSMFCIVNEPLQHTIGKDVLTSFYIEAHNMIRSITGFGEGNGPYIAIGNGFDPLTQWANFLPGSDRIIMDSHTYMAFDNSPALDPIDTGTDDQAGGKWPAAACTRWAADMTNSRINFGVNIAGEFSNAINDCSLFLRGPQYSGVTYGGNCNDWTDSTNWTPGTKAGLMHFARASMDALGDWFFWTWKISPSQKGIVESPLWSYQLGLENGWIPTDPRTSNGTCQALGVTTPAFDGSFQPWQTGGAGAGTIAPSATSAFPWPPPTLANVDVPVSQLPTYTPTGPIVSLPPPTFTPKPSKSIGVNGWYNSKDTASAPTPVAGCTYPDPYDAVNATVPPKC